jgi:hypothetical protein
MFSQNGGKAKRQRGGGRERERDRDVYRYIYTYLYTIYLYVYIYHISRIYQPHYPMIFPLNTTVIHLPFGDLCALLEAAEVGALLRRSHGCLGSSGYRHGGYLWGSISSMV